ncbi:MAG: SNF2-related protein, partial [Clostridiales bacterium]|nr:SNF2-related protein [Clostridiales bacterium]
MPGRIGARIIVEIANLQQSLESRIIPEDIVVRFKGFNIAGDFQPEYNKNTDINLRKFALAVFVKENPIKLEKNSSFKYPGDLRIFLEYLQNNGAFINGYYFLSHIHLDIVLSLLPVNTTFQYDAELAIPMSVSQDLHRPGFIVKPVDKGYFIQFTEKLDVIPGKYSVYILRENKFERDNTVFKEKILMKLSDELPQTFYIQADGAGAFVDQENSARFYDQTIPVLQKAFAIDDVSMPKKIHLETGLNISVNKEKGLLEFDLDFHCDKLGISKADLFEAIRHHQGFMISAGNYMEFENQAEIFRLLEYLDENGYKNIAPGKYEGRLFKAFEIDKLENEGFESIKIIADKAFYTMQEEFRARKTSEEVVFPDEYDSILRRYQKDGVRWMHFLRKYSFGGILADEMGLGKTLQVLTMLSIYQDSQACSRCPSLVICPKTLIHNWQNEVRKFAPALRVLAIDGSLKERSSLIRDVQEFDLVITSYPLIQRDCQHYKDIEF